MADTDGRGPGVPAGWYPDTQTGGQRYWDGVQWTEHRAPAMPPAPPPAPPGMPVHPAAPTHATTDKPWYQQTKWIVGGVVAALVVVGAATGDGSTEDEVDEASSSAVPPSATSEVEEGVEQQPEQSEQVEAKKEGADEAARARAKRPKVSETFLMPATVGMVLQDAQDLLQSKGSYILTQTDAMGWGRFQVLDSGWKVCWQEPSAGTVTPLSFMVDLGVVKLDESCP